MSQIRVERDVRVEMRDGVGLATDVYRSDDDERHPVLVHRTPYSKGLGWFVAGLMFNPLDAVERGYAVLVQDTRGRLASEGEWEPFVDEAADGYDTVEWAAEQPWSDGNVGIYGSSYMGVTTVQAMVAAPPHLKAGLAYVTSGTYHNAWTYSGGAFELGFNLWWTNFLGWDTAARLEVSDEERAEMLGRLANTAADPWSAARQLPLISQPAFDQGVAAYWRTWLEHPPSDDYWKPIDAAANADKMQAPLLQVAAWYDNFLRGQLDLYHALKGTQAHRIVIGPWDHEAYLSLGLSTAGERDFGPVAMSGPATVAGLAFDWFDHLLMGKETPLLDTPKARYFVMGSNIWEEAEEWPPPHTLTDYYLRSGGQANTRFGDGALTLESPEREPADSFVYDPSDPVPSVGGRTLHPNFGPGGVQNQAQIEEREDILVYTSARLTAPVTVCGAITVTLFAVSSAQDTDFTAKLVDVSSDEYCANVAEGIIRARYRNESDSLLEPGAVTEFSIDLWEVAYTFAAGNRIRLEVSSSNFPRYSRNLNSAERPELAGPDAAQTAVQQILHDNDHPSRLTLPVID